MDTTLIKSYAEKYFDFGWNLVPLFDYSKNPASGNKYLPIYWQNKTTKENFLEKQDNCEEKQGWWPFSQRRQTRDELNNWLNDKNLTGLGVITGDISNITVFDEDSYKEGGKKFPLATPLIAKTTSGGFHHYFKYSDDVKTAGVKQGVFIEIKSAGGFIVLPPTKAKNKQGEVGQYTWFKKNIKTINDLPVIDLSKLGELDLQPKEVVQTVLGDLTHVELGEQHESLRSLTNSLLFKHNPKDWEEFVYPIIREKASQYNPPHPPQRVEKMLSDCTSFVLRKKNEKKSPQSIQQVAKKRIAERAFEEGAPLTGYPDLDNILKGFIPGRVYCLSGLTNVGKTSVAANFATRVAKQDKKVLYFALEPDNNIVDYLASAQTGKAFHLLNDQDLYDVNNNVHIYTKNQIASLSDMLTALRNLPHYDLVIIDHLGYFIQGDSKSGSFQEQANALKKLVNLAQQERTAVMFIVHMRKRTGYQKKSKDDSPSIPGIDELKGSSALSQDSTDVMFVTRGVEDDGVTQTNDGRIVVVKTKSGKNGAVEVHFVDNSARIIGPEEFGTSMF